MVFVTSVVFDAVVFDKLCRYISRDDGQRSDIVNKALNDAMATPGWIEAALVDMSIPHLIAFARAEKPPSSNSRIHARGSVDGPKTKRSPGSRPPKSKAARSSKRGGGEKK